jgi:phage anti-repressor protein
MIEYGFEEGKDYSLHKNVQRVNGITNEVHDWAVQIDMAKNIAMIQRSDRGKAIREYLLNLDKRVQEGHLLNHAQISVLLEICKVLGFFTIQKFFENEHFEMKEKPAGWWDYRSKLLGYTTNDLKEIIEALGKKYKNQRQALMHIDRYELIRMAAVDMFIAMGKSAAYAQNVGHFVKTIAKEIKPEIYDDSNTSIDFKTPEQQIILEELKSYKEQSKLLDKF